MANDKIEVQRLSKTTIIVPIVSTTPLVTHRFSEKARKEMLDAMQGVKKPRTKKDPKAEYENAMYRFEDGGYGFPAIGFKCATVSGARLFGGSVKMTHLKSALFFKGNTGVDGTQLMRIIGEPVMREDVVKVGISGHDLRYRPLFKEWKTSLEVEFVDSLISLDSVLSLIEAGGMGVGVGEWRPERGGDWGTYKIDPDTEIEVIGGKK